MLKDKNYEAAMNIVSLNPTPKLSTNELADMIADLKTAEDAYTAHAAEVKKHYNEIYEPMCAKKRELEIKMHELRIRTEGLGKADPKVDGMIKLVMKALAKQTK